MLGWVVGCARDPAGDVITQTDALTAYDLAGNVLRTTTPLSQTTAYTYDAASEPTTVQQPDGSTQQSGYDATGNVITQTDGLTRTTTYGYDALNRVITTTDPLTRTTVYSYDLVGNQTVMTDAAGLPTRYGYDADQELTGITYALTSTPDVTYTYTASGQRASMTDGTGTSTDQYSPLDQVITSTNGAGQSVGYRYDPVGNLTTLIYPDSSAITRTYDAANRLTGITDWLGHSTGFAYDAADRLITQTYPNTTTATFSYNAADQLTGIVDRANGTPFWTYGYTRDALGNLSAASDPINGNDSYSYDAQSRLSQDQRVVSGITATTSWNDDAAEEIRSSVYTTTSHAAITSTLGYDGGSALTNLQVLSGTTLTHNYIYTSTATGARSAVIDTLSVAQGSYTYDQADRLIGYNAGTGQYSCGYDGDGLRQSTALSGTTEASTWDTAEGLPQLLQDGATRYVMGPDGLPLEQVSGTGTVLYYYQDQFGSLPGMQPGQNVLRLVIGGRGEVYYTYLETLRHGQRHTWPIVCPVALATSRERGTVQGNNVQDPLGSTTHSSPPNVVWPGVGIISACAGLQLPSLLAAFLPIGKGGLSHGLIQ